MKETIDKAIVSMAEALENDKTLIIFVFMVWGIIALGMRFDGSMALIEKLGTGLLGMAVGRTLDKR